jgi:integrase
VPISSELATCLRTLGVVSGTSRLFPYGRRTVREWWTDICAAAAIKGVTIHDIRATFITLALDAGVPPVEVQTLVGHSDITMTMKYYRNSEQSHAAAARVRQALAGWFARSDSGPVPALVTAPSSE